MWHFGMKLFSPGELDTSLCLNCAISSYQIQMCIRPKLNPQQRHMTVMISLDIQTFFKCFFLYFFVHLIILAMMGGAIKAKSSRYRLAVTTFCPWLKLPVSRLKF